MKLTILDRKKFESRYPDRQISIFILEPYGPVEIEYSGSILHKLRPTSSQASLQALPEFKQIVVCGTPFQAKVWQALLTIPAGCTVSYSDIAKQVGHVNAVRAVGSAIGANPIGIILPCHRVIAKDGGLGGFAWGLELKKKWLALESTKVRP